MKLISLTLVALLSIVAKPTQFRLSVDAHGQLVELKGAKVKVTAGTNGVVVLILDGKTPATARLSEK